MMSFICKKRKKEKEREIKLLIALVIQSITNIMIINEDYCYDLRGSCS